MIVKSYQILASYTSLMLANLKVHINSFLTTVGKEYIIPLTEDQYHFSEKYDFLWNHLYTIQFDSLWFFEHMGGLAKIIIVFGYSQIPGCGERIIKISNISPVWNIITQESGSIRDLP